VSKKEIRERRVAYSCRMAGRARLLVAMAGVGAALYAAAGCAWSLEGFTGGEEPDAAPSPVEASVDSGGAADAGLQDAADAGPAAFLSIDSAETTSGSTFDLTALGPLDWTQWTRSAVTRCAPCTPRISALTITGQAIRYADDLRMFRWTNGTPVAIGSSTEGVFVDAVGDHFDLVVDAAPARAVLTLHVDTFYAGATLSAEIAGAGLVPQKVVFPAVDMSALYAIKVHFSGPAGLSAHLTWSMTDARMPPDPGDRGNIAIIAATLAPE
jgi:hypothetical protein